MKLKSTLIVILLLVACTISYAQNEKANTSGFGYDFNMSFVYNFVNFSENMGLNKKNGDTFLVSADYYINPKVFVGGGLGWCSTYLTSEYEYYNSTTWMHTFQIPVYIGLNINHRLLSIDTGPYFEIPFAATTTLRHLGDEISKTKLKDMNGVNDIALGWAINFRIARFIKFSIGTTLTDSVFGDDIGMTTISIGVGL